jgi:ferrochelatase
MLDSYDLDPYDLDPWDLDPYDGVLLISFGGPEGPEEVMPFLQRVTAGRGVPQERLERIAEHYFVRGGISPITAETRKLAAALQIELSVRGVELPLEIGNRNAAPFVDEALRRLAERGATRVLALTTSAYPSYSSCRQYTENLAAAIDTVAGTATVDRIRHYAHHPGFASATTDGVTAALAEFGTDRPPAVTRLVFVTHSLPLAMARTSGPPPHAEPGSYVDWHRVVAAEVSRRVSPRLDWDLAYCSRSGSPAQPWLEPDINDHLVTLAEEGVSQVVVVPIGFTSDHMEVVHDLDTEARATADRLGLRFRRAATVGTHPEFVAGLVDLMVERAAVARGQSVRQAVIAEGSPGRYACPADCCPPLRRPDRPSLQGDPRPAT